MAGYQADLQNNAMDSYLGIRVWLVSYPSKIHRVT